MRGNLCALAAHQLRLTQDPRLALELHALTPLAEDTLGKGRVSNVHWSKSTLLVVLSVVACADRDRTP